MDFLQSLLISLSSIDPVIGGGAALALVAAALGVKKFKQKKNKNPSTEEDLRILPNKPSRDDPLTIDTKDFEPENSRMAKLLGKDNNGWGLDTATLSPDNSVDYDIPMIDSQELLENAIYLDKTNEREHALYCLQEAVRLSERPTQKKRLENIIQEYQDNIQNFGHSLEKITENHTEDDNTVFKDTDDLEKQLSQGNQTHISQEDSWLDSQADEIEHEFKTKEERLKEIKDLNTDKSTQELAIAIDEEIGDEFNKEDKYSFPYEPQSSDHKLTHKTEEEPDPLAQYEQPSIEELMQSIYVEGTTEDNIQLEEDTSDLSLKDLQQEIDTSYNTQEKVAKTQATHTVESSDNQEEFFKDFSTMVQDLNQVVNGKAAIEGNTGDTIWVNWMVLKDNKSLLDQNTFTLSHKWPSQEAVDELNSLLDIQTDKINNSEISWAVVFTQVVTISE